MSAKRVVIWCVFALVVWQLAAWVGSWRNPWSVDAFRQQYKVPVASPAALAIPSCKDNPQGCKP